METKVTAIVNLEDIPRVDLLNYLQSELLNGEPFGDSLITQLEYAIANRKRRQLPLPINDTVTVPASEINNVSRSNPCFCKKATQSTAGNLFCDGACTF